MSDKDKKEARRKKRGAQMMGAVGDFAGSVAAGLLAEAKQKGSGAGFAAAFAQGVAPIVDFGKIMRGKADPGTVLGRVGLNAMRSNASFASKDPDDDNIEQDAMNEVDNDPLALESGLGEESIVMSDDEVAEVARAALEAATGPSDPLENLPDGDRGTVAQLALGGKNLDEGAVAAATNDLVNRHGPKAVRSWIDYIIKNPDDFRPMVGGTAVSGRERAMALGLTEESPGVFVDATGQAVDISGSHPLDTDGDGMVDLEEAQEAVKPGRVQKRLGKGRKQ
jgi:hypothetical protein